MSLRFAGALLCSLLLLSLAHAADPPALQRGIELFDQGKNAEARAALLPFATAKPPSAEAEFYLGRIAMRADDAKEAERWFQDAVKQADSNAAYHLWLGRAYGTQAEHAGKLSQFGLARKTRSEFERASALDPANLDAREDLISYYLEAPSFMGGSVEKAREQADQIRKRDALRGVLASAQIAEDQKDLPGAEREYQSAMRLAPDSLNVRYALGQFYTRSTQYDKAFATFEEILKQRPGEAAALYQIGRTGAISGQRLDRAEAALQQFLTAPSAGNAPKPEAAHWRLGMVYEKAGKKDRARQEYQRSIAINPEFKEARKSLSALR
jgi:tetratricopeptide (TPR) repeat protein